MTQRVVTGSCAASIKAATQSLHASTESALIPMLKKAASPEDYHQILLLFYRIFAPLEKRLQPWLTEASVPDLSRRRKANLLLQDLNAAGYTGPVPSLPPALPSITSQEEAWGALYVLEGSTMGGAVIAKMLRARIDLPTEATRFFDAYGPERETLWRRFLQALDANLSSDADVAAATEGARRTFHYFHAHITQLHGSAPY